MHRKTNATIPAPPVERIPDEERDLVTMPEIKDFSRGVRGPYIQSLKILRERRAKDRVEAAKTTERK
jgi:hypothetical protein